MKRLISPVVIAVLAGLACGPAAEETPVPAAPTSVFARDNLVAWCIVPFDASKRGPAERAQMLKRLGFKALAYDYRDEHVPTFDEEISTLKAEGITLASWWCGNVDPADPLGGSAGLALETLRRNQASADLWISLSEKALTSIPAEERTLAVAQAVDRIAQEAESIQARVGLYNHGGWFGEPENQLAILAAVRARNVGMVYNFHHGREHLSRFPELFQRMLPHLITVNLNGTTEGGEMIIPLGQGERDLEILRMIRDSGYSGPIGILDHRNELDAEESLRENLDGLKKLLAELGDQAGLESYQ